MKLTELKGIGPKTAALFEKIGITDTDGLIRAYPVGYDAYERPCSAGEVRPGARAAVRGVITGPVAVRRAGRVHITTTVISDPTGSVRLTWFNAPFIAPMLKKGACYIFRGTARERRGGTVIDHPAVFAEDKYGLLENTLVPVYGLTKGLTGKTFAKAVSAALESDTRAGEEYLPESLVRLCGLMDEKFAVRAIHFPADARQMEEARRRLVFDEFFLFILSIRLMKSNSEEQKNEFPMKALWETEEVIENLPFRLTPAQSRVWREIESDLCGDRLMSRLIQGDVGSGKTVLAFLAMILTAANGYQSVLMAPTEVLARQHFEKLMKLKAQQRIDSLRPVLLTGALKAAERKSVLSLIESGEANAVVGTHALIQESVRYPNLGLMITDEQHRFGVRQRNTLRERERPPHMLVMSATPIPRTLGVVFYGDLDISVIDELPASRRPVRSAVVDETYREQTMRFLRKQAAAGRQIYVICPMIEPSDSFETYNVTDETASFRKEFPDLSVGMLHGRMSPDEKNRAMEDFLSGKTQILVSTTVIEVGVDVPNASVMLILGAERFGLAQLHQLRGRVGRGEYQSYCIFLAGQKSEAIDERLGILRDSTDGFRIAEKDLALRGPGDLLGIRQSGDALFRIADVARDAEILTLAGRTAAAVLEDDPALLAPEHSLLRRETDRLMTANGRNIVL